MADDPGPALREPDARPDPVATLVAWEPWSLPNEHLLGHCSILFAGGWQVAKVPIFRRKDGSLSVGVPSMPVLDAEGRVRMRDGKRQYLPLISFTTAAARARWDRAVLAALAAGGIGPTVESVP